MGPLQPQDIVERALAACGADGCVVIATEHSEANLRWAANGLTTNGTARSRSVTVVAVEQRPDGPAAGSASATVTTADELEAVVRAAEFAAAAAPVADDGADLVAPYAHDDDWSADPGATSVAELEEFAGQLATQFAAWSGRDELLFGFAEHTVESTFLGVSTGLRRRFDQPAGRLELNAKSRDLRRSAWAGSHQRSFAGLDLASVTDDLRRRLGWAQTRIDLPAGRYETILPPTAVADLMIDAYWNAGAREAEEGRSVYARADGGTRIGDRLAALPLTLRSDPGEAGLECAPFEIATSSGGPASVFDNGTPVGPAKWIDGGVLGDLMRTRAWAARTGTAPRPAVGNLVLEMPGADGDLDALVAGTERGLLLTSLWYIREVDPQTLLPTGLTRDGVYLVEDGAVRAAVNNFRFNESPVSLLARASAAGRSEPTLSREWHEYFPRTAMPALRVPDFLMSTVSPAN